MALNFEQTKKGKIGDIIYPSYNKTNGFWTKPRWDLVIAVDKEGNIIGRSYIWDFATVRAIELIQELEELK